MTATAEHRRAELRRGHCPGVLRPMVTGDGLLVRVRVTAGRLTSHRATALAACAARHGSGLLDLSSRANLQIRGVTAGTLTPLTHALDELGLIDTDAATEHVRNVLVDPLSADGAELASALEAALTASPELGALPAKFGFLLDAGGPSGLANEAADVSFRRLTPDRFSVGLGGTDSASELRLGSAARDRLPALAVALATRFLKQRDVSDDAPRRTGKLLAARPDAFKDFAFDGLMPPDRDAAASASAVRAHHIGPATAIEPWIGFGLAFGRLTSADLEAIASFAARHGTDGIRLTPWRAILVPVDDESVHAANADAEALALRHGLLLNPDDPLHRIAACPGSRGCLSGRFDAQGLARRLACRLADGQAGGSTIHVSGCLKGCAHPGPAPLTLTADDGGFLVVANGGAADDPVASGLSEDAAFAMILEKAVRPTSTNRRKKTD